MARHKKEPRKRKQAHEIKPAAVEGYHVPVLLHESVEMLISTPDGVYVDATLGGAGHTRSILRSLGPKGKLFGFDQDPDARANSPEDERFTFVPSNFRHITYWMDYFGVRQIDGILVDLGVSSHHFDTPERGFSFRFTEALPDMRMNLRASLTARELLNSADEARLSEIFRSYGELSDAARVANLIVSERRKTHISTMGSLLTVLSPVLPKMPTQRHRKLSRIFQALRIEVNDEMGALKALLNAAGELLAPAGRLVILTYHSLEDRIVKEWMKKESLASQAEGQKLIYGDRPGKMKILTGKAVQPSREEISCNSRASSAKMRVAEKRPRQEPEADCRSKKASTKR